MFERLTFFFSRLREKLWIRPLVFCILSIVVVLLAKIIGRYDFAPEISFVSTESIESLLHILSSGMLVIATFAVGSMVAAYASASNTATPRSFSLIISDDLSQNALSTFLGAFIFGIVALVSVQNEYFSNTGLLVLFALTVTVFSVVVITFVRWVDKIARLGRLGATIDKVEEATSQALKKRKKSPALGGTAVETLSKEGSAIYSEQVGFVQRVDVKVLQNIASKAELRVEVAALPGTFVAPGVPIAYVQSEQKEEKSKEIQQITKGFIIGGERKFDEDPRFGFVVLAEIAGKALSPAINDPGTAIDILGTCVRLFTNWQEQFSAEDGEKNTKCDRVFVPLLSIDDMFDDVFHVIARDGVSSLEVGIRLQKSLKALASIKNDDFKTAAKRHSSIALARAEHQGIFKEDLQILKKLAQAFHE